MFGRKTRMKFTKMQGAGNDFIIINNMEEKLSVEKLGTLAKRICTRHLSIGADGLMVVDAPTGGGDYKMRFYNADGSLGEMCGNGARCIARYGYENGLAGITQRVETTAGLVIGERIDERQYRIRLNDISKINIDEKITVDGIERTYSYVELGNPGLPHVVMEIPGLSTMDKEELRHLGKELRYNKKFPKGANVNFYEITGRDTLAELTYERGVEDFTMACGTGTGSVAAVLTEKNLVSGNDVHVSVPGGELFITIKKDFKNGSVKDIFLTGPTNIVAEGVVTDEELLL